jgi:hypothetical protein
VPAYTGVEPENPTLPPISHIPFLAKSWDKTTTLNKRKNVRIE